METRTRAESPEPPTPEKDEPPKGESALTVLIAFGANAAVAAAKTAAAVFTGSASMLAEAAHSWADTGNQVFLLVAQKKVTAATGRQPAPGLRARGLRVVDVRGHGALRGR